MFHGRWVNLRCSAHLGGREDESLRPQEVGDPVLAATDLPAVGSDGEPAPCTGSPLDPPGVGATDDGARRHLQPVDVGEPPEELLGRRRHYDDPRMGMILASGPDAA